jgi:hypothetical protein
MLWKDKATDNFTKFKNGQIKSVWLDGLELKFEDCEYNIDLRGIYSVRKRKIINQGVVRDSYKICIEDYYSENKYIGINEIKNVIYVYPIVQSKGVLFNQINKKLLINKKKNRIDFTVDGLGRVGA